MEYIYALYYEWEDQRQYFYVGRTTRDPKIRHGEHTLKVRRGTEDVYCFIREKLQPCGIDVWDMEILGNDEDSEDYWVVLMIRAGYDLKNMKHGDARKIAELRELAEADGDFTTVAEFHVFRERQRKAAYERSQALKEEVLASSNPALDELFENVRNKFQKENANKISKNKLKEERASAKIKEKHAWLRCQQGLFE